MEHDCYSVMQNEKSVERKLLPKYGKICYTPIVIYYTKGDVLMKKVVKKLVTAMLIFSMLVTHMSGVFVFAEENDVSD